MGLPLELLQDYKTSESLWSFVQSLQLLRTQVLQNDMTKYTTIGLAFFAIIIKKLFNTFCAALH